MAIDLLGHDWTGNTNGDMTISSSYHWPSLDDWKTQDGGLAGSDYFITNVAGWWKVDLGSGNKAFLESVDLYVNTIPEPNRAPKDFTIQGSNNDSDWDTLTTETSETSWGSGEGRNFTTVDTTAYRYFKIDITDNNGDVQYSQIAELYLWGAFQRLFNVSINAASSVSGIDMAGGTIEDSLIDQVGLDDTIVASGGSETVDITDIAGIDDTIAVGGTFNTAQVDIAGIADWINGGLETNHFLTDGVGLDDSIDCLNWSEFLRNNQDRYIIKYFCVLTGENDDTTDIEIPIKQFQARKRDGKATYLSVSIPSFDNAQEIADRSNGQVVIQMAYFVGDIEELREEILRVDLENIRTDDGPVNRSITLSGHFTETFGGQIAVLENPIYKYESEGIRRFRFAVPDPWINPGDTARIGGDEFRVGYITYIISERYRQMEVTEAS